MPEPKRPLKVFLCHASTDKPKVRELYRYLKKRGIQPWFDEEDLVGGQDWQVEIPKALATSDAIIICLTKNSVDKEGYIQKEIKFALDKALEMPEGRIFLIPVKFEDCEVPFTLSRYQWVDLTVESGYAKMMKALKFRTSHLERTTVELSKKDVEEKFLLVAEPLKRQKTYSDEKAEKGKQKLEPTETHKQEKSDHETVEKSINLRPQVEKSRQEISSQKKSTRVAFGISIFAISIICVLSLLFIFKQPPFEPDLTPTATSILPVPSNTTIVQPSRTASVINTPTISITETSSMGKSVVSEKDGMELLYVPEEQVFSNIADQLVTVVAFWIDKTPITNAQFRKFVDSTGYVTEPEINRIGFFCINAECKAISNDNWKLHADVESNPVVQVSWNDAKSYCEWAGREIVADAEFRAAVDVEYLVNYSEYSGINGEWLADKTSNLHRAIIGGWGYFSYNSNKMDMSENRSASNLTFRCMSR